MATLAEYEAKRAAAQRRLAEMLEQRQRNAQWEMDRTQQEEAARAKQFGDSAAEGAAGGSQFGPWGAAIGAIAGGAKGQYGAYGQRRKEGEGRIDAFINTLTDLPAYIPSQGAMAGASPALGKAYAGEKDRTTPMEMMEGLAQDKTNQTGAEGDQFMEGYELSGQPGENVIPGRRRRRELME
jgi:hypothetical protein